MIRWPDQKSISYGVCMDEKPYQLLDDCRKPLLIHPGDDTKIDSEYIRNGTCSIFVFTEPLMGYRHVSVREHRTSIDCAVAINIFLKNAISKIKTLFVKNLHEIIFNRDGSKEALKCVIIAIVARI